MMHKFLILFGLLLGSATYLLFSLGASFETAVATILLALLFVAAGAALRIVEPRPYPEQTPADSHGPDRGRAEGEGGVEGEA